MPFQSVPDTAIIEVRATNNGIPVENTFYAKFPSQPTAEELEELALNVGTVITEEWLPALPASWVGVEVYAKGLTDIVDNQGSSAIIAGDLGTAAGAPLPNNVTFAVRRTSGLTGRSSRGRIYWMGLVAGHLDANENFITSTVANAFAALCDEVTLAIASSGATEVIVSRYSEGVLREFGVTFPVVGYSWSDLRVDTQRGRLE